MSYILICVIFRMEKSVQNCLSMGSFEGRNFSDLLSPRSSSSLKRQWKAMEDCCTHSNWLLVFYPANDRVGGGNDRRHRYLVLRHSIALSLISTVNNLQIVSRRIIMIYSILSMYRNMFNIFTGTKQPSMLDHIDDV